MPIETADILYKLSTKSGSAGNSQAQVDLRRPLGAASKHYAQAVAEKRAGTLDRDPVAVLEQLQGD